MVAVCRLLAVCARIPGLTPQLFVLLMAAGYLSSSEPAWLEWLLPRVPFWPACALCARTPR